MFRLILVEEVVRKNEVAVDQIRASPEKGGPESLTSGWQGDGGETKNAQDAEAFFHGEASFL